LLHSHLSELVHGSTGTITPWAAVRASLRVRDLDRRWRTRLPSPGLDACPAVYAIGSLVSRAWNSSYRLMWAGLPRLPPACERRRQPGAG
jgi:hypothetical protein